MSWRRAAGVVAVLLVVGGVGGTVAALLAASDSLLGSPEFVPAIASLAVVVIALAATVLAADPSSDWFGNPYW